MLFGRDVKQGRSEVLTSIWSSALLTCCLVDVVTDMPRRRGRGHGVLSLHRSILDAVPYQPFDSFILSVNTVSSVQSIGSGDESTSGSR